MKYKNIIKKVIFASIMSPFGLIAFLFAILVGAVSMGWDLGISVVDYIIDTFEKEW